MHRNSVSLCMVVRDAEETVGRAIKSALAIVDEVVVVDQGSADNTRLIVEGYGARVVEHPRDGDAAGARNAGISAAYGDWVLVLGADEMLDSIRPVEVSRLLANDRVLGWSARVIRTSADGSTTRHEEMRLFRNHPLARYRYAVCEEILPALEELAGEQGRELRPSRLKVRRQPATSGGKGKSQALLQHQLRQAVRDEPDEPWYRYRLAMETLVFFEDRVLPVKGFSVHLDLLESAVGQVRGDRGHARAMRPWREDLHARHAAALLAADRVDEAAAAAEEGMRHCDAGALLTYVHARALIEQASRRPREEADALLASAEQSLRRLLEGPVGRGSTPVSERFHSVYPMVQLGYVALARADFDEARERFRHAMRSCPASSASLAGLGHLARAEGRVRDAMQIFLKVIAIDDRDVEAWIGGAETQIELGFVDNARSWLGRLEQVLPEHPRLDALLARIGASAGAHAGS